MIPQRSSCLTQCLISWAFLLLTGGAIASDPNHDPAAKSLPGDAKETKTLEVSKTFNDAPFAYRMQLQEARRGYRIFHLTFPSPVKTAVEANNTVPAEYYVPEGAEQGAARPAVLVLHILNGNFELERLLCSSLAARGIPAIMIKLPYYGERSLPGGHAELNKRPDLFLEAIPQGIEDARRTIDLLSSRAEVDSEKIGVTGISLGGLLAGTTAGADPRVHRAALLLAGGDLLAIIHHCREARDLSDFLKRQPPDERAKFERAIAGVDPLAHAAALRERAIAGRVLMMNAAEDDVIPPACTNKLADALGIKDKVVWFEGLGHYTAIAALPQTFRRMTDFFAQDLPAGVKAPIPDSPASGTPVQALSAILQQAASFVTTEPDEGRCHLIDITAKVAEKDGAEHEAHLRLVHGASHKFRIEAKLNELGEGTWAQGDRPWIASATTVFVGEKPEKTRDPLAEADPKHVAKYKTLAAGVGGWLLLPGLLEQTLDIKDDKPTSGPSAIQISIKGKPKDAVRLTLDNEQRPARATFDVGETKGEVQFRAWQFNTIAPEELFQPPSDRPTKQVESSDLYRMFGASFDFLMEQSE